jgi:inhibitor of cysteine peptidase
MIKNIGQRRRRTGFMLHGQPLYGTIRMMTTTVLCVFVFSLTAAAETALTEKDNGRTLCLKPREELLITLPANPTTGYRWEAAEPGDNPAVQLIAVGFMPSAAPYGAIGAGGVERFRIRLLKPGRFAVAFVYRRPWEKDRAPEGVFRLILDGTCGNP